MSLRAGARLSGLGSGIGRSGIRLAPVQSTLASNHDGILRVLPLVRLTELIWGREAATYAILNFSG